MHSKYRAFGLLSLFTLFLLAPIYASAQATNVTPQMWSEINAQRSAFGDPNDCQSRVAAIPSTGYVLPAGGDIASALSSNSVVVLQTGTYRPTGSLLAIPTGKKLVAGPGQNPVVDLSALTNFGAVYVGDNAVVSGIEFKNAQGISIITFDTGRGAYSSGGLLYNLTVHDSGRTGSMDDGTGVTINGGSNWCVVSLETYNSWNQAGSSGNNANDPTRNGGNSDGIQNKYGASQNTFIAINSHNNGDDGMDMWEGGQAYWYFSSSHDNGKVPGVTNGGDGNGVKLGRGDVAHKFYKTTANNNGACGYDLNANLQDPILVQSTASGNPRGDYCYFLVAP